MVRGSGWSGSGQWFVRPWIWDLISGDRDLSGSPEALEAWSVAHRGEGRREVARAHNLSDGRPGVVLRKGETAVRGSVRSGSGPRRRHGHPGVAWLTDRNRREGPGRWRTCRGWHTASILTLSSSMTTITRAVQPTSPAGVALRFWPPESEQTEYLRSEAKVRQRNSWTRRRSPSLTPRKAGAVASGEGTTRRVENEGTATSSDSNHATTARALRVTHYLRRRTTCATPPARP